MGAQHEASRADDKATTRLALGMGAAVVLVIGGCMALGAAGGEDAKDNRAGAERICRQAVEKQLKDPGSAEFSAVSAVITEPDEPVFGYEVTGTVRSRNSFGGMVTITYSCDATYDTDSGMARGTAVLTEE